MSAATTVGHQDIADATQDQAAKKGSGRKVESIEEIKETDKTRIGRTYTIWASGAQNKLASSEENALKPVFTFNTVEDFWAAYQHFKRPALQSFGSSIQFFVNGVKPEWEDEQCINGGKLTLRVPKTHSNKYWEDLLLALVGDQFTNEQEVVGILINVRPGRDVIQIWNRSGKDEAQVNTLKSDVERILRIDEEEGIKLEYMNFKDALNSNKDDNAVAENAEPKKDWHREKKAEPESGSGWGRNPNEAFRGRGRGRGQTE